MTALAFSPDGTRLAVGMYGQTALYDTVQWRFLARTSAAAGTVRALAFEPNGELLVIGSGEPGGAGKVGKWNIPTQVMSSFRAQLADGVEAIAFGPGGELFIGGDGRTAWLLPQDNPSIFKLEDHNDRVTAVAASAKGDLFATGGMDKMVKVWKTATHKAIVNFDQSEAGITGLAFLPNGTTLVGSSLDGRLYWWNVNYDSEKKEYVGRRVRTSDAHPGGVNALGISANGQRLITGGDDKQVRVWEAASGRSLKIFSEPRGPIYAVALSPDGKTAAAAGREGKVYVWSVEDGRLAAVVAPAGLEVAQAVKSSAKGKPSR